MLYTRDPDWNTLLPALSGRLIGEQLSLQDFLCGFTEFTKEIPLKTVRPAISTVVYRTTCEQWSPADFRSGIPAIENCAQVHQTINHEAHTLVVVTARRAQLEWTDVGTLFSWQWELYVAVWSPGQNLLFINSSTNAGEYKGLAQAIAGTDAALVRGQQVFRTFAGVNRLRLQNVGLTEQLGRNVRYTGRMGSDVEPAISDLHRGRTRKSVLSGTGYEGGQRVAVGASQKGRIWSHRRDRVDELAAWCERIGEKLLDENIDPDEVLSGTLRARTIVERPDGMPIGVDWPEEMYRTPESMWIITIGKQERQLCEVDIGNASASLGGPLRIGLSSEDAYAELELTLFEDAGTPNYRFVTRGDATVRLSRRGRLETSIQDFFYDNPPVIWFADGSALEGNQYVELRTHRPPYDASKIRALDWSGVNLRKESQGAGREADSIQARVIRHLKRQPYAVIFDDDGKGEAADVVTIGLVGDQTAPESIEVGFFHCKYSQTSTPGRRIQDLYEVCGQAQKSVSWMISPEKRTDLFTHLMRREALREDRAHSRFPGTVCRQRWTVRLGEVEPVFGQTGRVVLDITAGTAHDGALKWTRAPSTPRAARSIFATFPSTCALPSGGRWSLRRVLQRPGRQRKRSSAKSSCGPSRTSSSAPSSPPCCNARCAPPRLATRRAPSCATCPGGCGATAWRPSTFAPPGA